MLIFSWEPLHTFTCFLGKLFQQPCMLPMPPHLPVPSNLPLEKETTPSGGGEPVYVKFILPAINYANQDLQKPIPTEYLWKEFHRDRGVECTAEWAISTFCTPYHYPLLPHHHHPLTAATSAYQYNHT